MDRRDITPSALHLTAVLLSGVLVTGCTRAQGAAWAPQLVLRGAATERTAARAADGRAGWGWRVEADLRWSLDRVGPPPVPPLDLKVPAEAPDAPACVDATLCAWERRARAEALAGWRRDAGEDAP